MRIRKHHQANMNSFQEVALMRFQYKVVPFIGQTKGSLSSADVARQLESVIGQHAAQGWEFYQLSDVNVEVQPGCISGLFGEKVQYVRFDQLIFRADEGADDALRSDISPDTPSGAETSEPARRNSVGRGSEWRCSCGHANPIHMAKCSGCRKWRSIPPRP